MGVCQGHGLEKAAVHRLSLECDEAQDCGKREYDLMLAIVTEGLGDRLPGVKWCCAARALAEFLLISRP